MLVMKDGSGNEVKGKFVYHLSLFNPSYVEAEVGSGQFGLGDEVYLYDEVGNVVFKGKVSSIREIVRGKSRIIAYSEFGRMIDDYRAVTFFKKNNKDIIDALVNLYNYSGNTVVGVDWSGVNTVDAVFIRYYVQKGYTINEIYSLLYLSGWYYTDYYDGSKWVLKPIVINDLGLSYVEGDNGDVLIKLENIEVDKSKIINKVIVKGKDIRKRVSEQGVVADGSDEYVGYGFIKTMHKIGGNMKLLINDVEYENAEVLAERGVILVDSSKVGQSYVVEYEWYDTPIIMKKNQASINKYGERMKVRRLDTTDLDSLVSYADSILNIFSEPILGAKMYVGGREFNLGDKFSLGLWNTATKTYDYIDVVVYEKFYVGGYWFYKIGNVGMIIGIMRDILERLDIDLSLMNIGATVELTDNDLDVYIKWQGHLLGREGGGRTKLEQVFQDGNATVSNRFEYIDVVFFDSAYNFIDEDDNYVYYGGSGKSAKIGKNNSGSSLRGYVEYSLRGVKVYIGLDYDVGANGIYVSSMSESYSLKGHVENLMYNYVNGVLLSFVYEGDLSSITSDTVIMNIYVDGSVKFRYLVKVNESDNTKRDIYLQKLSSGDETLLLTVDSSVMPELKFILEMRSNAQAGEDGGSVRISALKSDGTVVSYEEDFGSNGTISFYVEYLNNVYCKGNIGVKFYDGLGSKADLLSSYDYDFLINKEVVVE